MKLLDSLKSRDGIPIQLYRIWRICKSKKRVSVYIKYLNTPKNRSSRKLKESKNLRNKSRKLMMKSKSSKKSTFKIVIIILLLSYNSRNKIWKMNSLNSKLKISEETIDWLILILNIIMCIYTLCLFMLWFYLQKSFSQNYILIIFSLYATYH